MGYPIPQYRKKNWEIPKYRVKNRRNTDTAFVIGHVYSKLYPSRVFVYLHGCFTRRTSFLIFITAHTQKKKIDKVFLLIFY